jgi:hypothetical protein
MTHGFDQSGRPGKDRRTIAVSNEVFRAVYDSPDSLPGAEVWVTPDADVRELESLLGLEQYTIGAPLWVSGDSRICPKCGRTISWLDIVASAVERVHDRSLITRVILGEQRFVNTEIPDAIAGVSCANCHTAIEGIRSFKCHNWAYAHGDIETIVERSSRI